MSGAVFPPCYLKWSEVAQLCPILCDPMDCSSPGSSVYGILQAWILEWVAISFSRGSFQPRDWTQVSRIVVRRFTVWATREAGAKLGWGNEDNGSLLQKAPCTHCYPQCPQPRSRPPPAHASARHPWALTGRSESVSWGFTAPFSWVLVCTRFCFCPPRICIPRPV